MGRVKTKFGKATKTAYKNQYVFYEKRYKKNSFNIIE